MDTLDTIVVLFIGLVGFGLIVLQLAELVIMRNAIREGRRIREEKQRGGTDRGGA